GPIRRPDAGADDGGVRRHALPMAAGNERLAQRRDPDGVLSGDDAGAPRRSPGPTPAGGRSLGEPGGVSATPGVVDRPDAVVVGSGPNGLPAAITLAQAGHSVRVLEAGAAIGGGCRSGELPLRGFVHDVCSAIHALAAASPFFRTLPLADYGLEWIEPPLALAHPFDDGSAAVLARSLDETAESL